MFDHTFLPPARCELIVIADTHYMIDPTGQQVEFGSRRRQTARTEHALQLVAALTADLATDLTVPLVIHMGDLIQEFPERPTFAQARDEALAQLAAHGVQPRFVAGNHDVGDKPDPTMPASWVTPAFLADYHTRFGRSWYSWTMAGVHFVVLNSQIMNSTLPAAAEQAQWLEADLAAHAGQRIFLFLHLPPFLHDAHEPDLGHYDNLAEPARTWLLALVQRYRVERLFAAHVHWSFYNEVPNAVGQTHYQTVPSVAFTRPGFSELFAGAPPAEQGRDDVAKLGFFLIRVLEAGSRVHLIRTDGRMDAPAPRARLITLTSPDLPHSPLGLTARHPLAPTGQVPEAWPSTVRQPVRNDYGLLSLLELGVRSLRVPATDLADPVQAARLAMARAQGIALTAQWLWAPGLPLAERVAAHAGQIDGVELHVLGALWPTAEALAQLQRCAALDGITVALSCVVPGRNVPGKQHGRSQFGYTVDQLVELNQRLRDVGVRLDRLCCRLDDATGRPLWAQLAALQGIVPLSQIGALDWLYTIPSIDPPTDPTSAALAQANAVAGAFFSLLPRPGDRLFVDPFIDFDRTMDAGLGLLDRLYNPRPAFHLLRHLNTVLYHRANRTAGDCDPGKVTVVQTAAYTSLRWTTVDEPFTLLLPTRGPTTITLAALGAAFTHQIGLLTGDRQPCTAHAVIDITEPLLFCGTI
jgi:hypothetical protein